MSAQSIIIERDGQQPFVIPVQPGGTTIEGTCGLGKSLTLECINVLFGGDQKDRIKATSGNKGTTVNGCGVVLHLSPSRASTHGEPEVGTLEEYPLEELIYPPFKKESAKHEHGIKCLLRISRAKADPSLFHYLAGDKRSFDSIVPPDAQKTADLVELAGRVKRAFQAIARKRGEEAQTEEAAAASDRDAMAGLNEKTPTDPAKLQAEHTSAVQAFARIKEQWDAYHKSQAAAEEARKKLKEATGSADTIADLEKANARAIAAENAASDEMMELEKQLREAKNRYNLAVLAHQSQENALNAAKRAEKLTAGWQATIDAAAGGTCPDAKQVLSAEIAVEEAQEAIEKGAVVRAAKARVAKAAEHQKKADDLRKEAHRLGLAADGTDAVLSKAVASSRFSVQGEFLMGHLPDGTVMPLYNMSDGQRSLLSIMEKIDRLCQLDPTPRLKICDVSQRTRQDLPPAIAEQIYSYAAEHNVCVVDGLVTDSPALTARVWRWNGSE